MDISFRTATCILAQSSAPIKLPASGRGLQPGSVGTTQSRVNAGGQNSVNLIDSSANNQGSYLGSVPTGMATASGRLITHSLLSHKRTLFDSSLRCSRTFNGFYCMKQTIQRGVKLASRNRQDTFLIFG